jgi:site-specific DNA-methyltransferase (adenine-specific)
LIQGDTLRVLSEMPDASVDAVVTDPPYSSGGQYRGDRTAAVSDKYQNSDSASEYPEFYGDTRDQRSYVAWCSQWLAEAWRVAVDGAPLVVCIDWRMLPSMTDAIQCGGWVWRGIVPWAKPNARRQPGRFAASCEFALWGSKGAMPMDRGADVNMGAMPGYFVANSVPSKDRQHVTEKPESIMRELIKIVRPGDLILDPFAGACTTAIAALIEGRRFTGIEMSAEYFEISCGRIRSLENLTHRKTGAAQGGLFTAQAQEPKT